MEKIKDAYEYIFRKRNCSGKLTLKKVKVLLDYLGNPQDKLKFVHIAGTNGKGSTTTMLSNVLMKAGYKVGKYVSPHVDNFYERMQINNTYITESELIPILERLDKCIESMEDAPSPFEIIAATAFEYYYINKCDIVCLEVGMGGRFDATNVITNTLISIIGVIDYDHMEQLGNTLEEIAFEKCGIIKEGKTTITYPLQNERAYKMIKTMAGIRGNRFVEFNIDDLTDVKSLGFNYSFKYKGSDYELGLNGEHQIYNSLMVIETANELNNMGYNISYEDICNGLKNSNFTGRMQKVKDSPCTILDGAHNVSGARAIKGLVKENCKNKNIILIAGMIQGKEHEEFFSELKDIFSHVIITKIKNNVKKSQDIDILKETAERYNKSVYAICNQGEAYAKAVELAGSDGIILISGSLYLVSEYNEMLK